MKNAGFINLSYIGFRLIHLFVVYSKAAASRIFNDKSTDELHTLHPLILDARWLFGAEFDSPMFVSNVALTTVCNHCFYGSSQKILVYCWIFLCHIFNEP